MTRLKQGPALNLSNLSQTASGDIVGAAVDADGRSYRFMAYPNTAGDDDLASLDISWIEEVHHPLTRRWSRLPGISSPGLEYRAGALTTSEFCYTWLCHELLEERHIDVDDFSDVRDRVRIYGITEGRPRGEHHREIAQAFITAWQQVAMEIRTAKEAS